MREFLHDNSMFNLANSHLFIQSSKYISPQGILWRLCDNFLHGTRKQKLITIYCWQQITIIHFLISRVSQDSSPKYIIHDSAIVWASECPFSPFSQEYCFIMFVCLKGRLLWSSRVLSAGTSGGKKSGSILEPFLQNISRLLRVRSDLLNLRLPRELSDESIWP